jgi:hypothetical protein
VKRHISPVLPNCAGDLVQGKILSSVKRDSATGFAMSECYSVERQADGDWYGRLINEPPTDIMNAV